jgi:hypothetical protein
VSGKEIDRIAGTIACMDTSGIPATLVSTVGSHCEVWQCIGRLLSAGGATPMNFVVKKYRYACSAHEVKVFQREYRTLRARLPDIVPDTVYIHTLVDGRLGVVVLAETFTPWFDIANPANEDEVVPLFRRLIKAQDQLRRFVEAAKSWRAESDPKLIDLCGVENLVLDKSYALRYVDSFGVFFYPDVLHMIDEVDERHKTRMETASTRLDYLDHLVLETA